MTTAAATVSSSPPFIRSLPPRTLAIIGAVLLAVLLLVVPRLTGGESARVSEAASATPAAIPQTPTGNPPPADGTLTGGDTTGTTGSEAPPRPADTAAGTRRTLKNDQRGLMPLDGSATEYGTSASQPGRVRTSPQRAASGGSAPASTVPRPAATRYAAAMEPVLAQLDRPGFGQINDDTTEAQFRSALGPARGAIAQARRIVPPPQVAAEHAVLVQSSAAMADAIERHLRRPGDPDAGGALLGNALAMVMTLTEIEKKLGMPLSRK